MKKDIRLILSDIDGTVLDDQHHIDPQLPARLRQLRERQIPFVLASARSPIGMAPIADKLGISDLPMICYNGALIMQAGQALISHGLVASEAQQIIRTIQTEFPDIAIGLYAGADWHCDKENQWTAHEAAITGETPKVADLLDLAQSTAIHKFLIIDTDETIAALHARLQALNLPETAFYLSKTNYLEVVHRTVSKATALQELAQHYGVSVAQTMALGDNFNDLPMLLAAGWGVATGNGPVGVQQQADAVTAANTAHGVSLALDTYVL